MSILSQRTVITLAFLAALGALATTPSLAGDPTPNNNTAGSTAAPVDPGRHRPGATRQHHHHQRPAGWGWNQRRFRLWR